MVKIETIKSGASASIIRNGQRQQVFEKQLISYDELNTLEVTGGDVIYSIDETEVHTKSPKPAPVVSPSAAEPKLSAKEKAKALKASIEKQDE